MSVSPSRAVIPDTGRDVLRLARVLRNEILCSAPAGTKKDTLPVALPRSSPPLGAAENYKTLNYFTNYGQKRVKK